MHRQLKTQTTVKVDLPAVFIPFMITHGSSSGEACGKFGTHLLSTVAEMAWCHGCHRATRPHEQGTVTMLQV